MDTTREKYFGRRKPKYCRTTDETGLLLLQRIKEHRTKTGILTDVDKKVCSGR